jgi:hypothetical protein
MTTAPLIGEWLEQNGGLCEGRIIDRASFDLLFRPEVRVFQAASVAPNLGANVEPNDICFRLLHYWTRFEIGSIVVIVGRPSDGGLRKIDGASRGVDFLRLFSRLDAGQDALREKSNLFFSPIVSVVIPIAFADFSRPFCVCFRSIRAFVHHESNRIGEFLLWVTNVLSRTTK